MRLNAKQSMLMAGASVLVGTLSLVYVVGQERRSADKPTRVNELLSERESVLVQVSKLQRAAYERGEASLDSVLASETDVLLAKLELADTAEQRIAIRESLVDAARQLEEAAKRLFEAGQCSQVDTLKAKALRLRAEADLIHERLPG